MSGRRGFRLQAMGREVRVSVAPGVPEGFVQALMDSWADCRPVREDGDGAATGPRLHLHPADRPQTSSLPQGTSLPHPADAAPGIRDQGVMLVPVSGPEHWAQEQAEFTTRLTLALIQEHLGQRHLFHAAVLMQPQTGHCLLLVGPSGRGKTTAARHMASAGWVYLSDETAAVDHRSGEVLPYPKPLSLLQDPGQPKAQLAPSCLGLAVADPAHGPRPVVAGILLLDRQPAPGEQAPAVRPVPLTEGLQALAEQSSGLARTPRGLELLAQLVDRVGGIHRVTYTEAETLPGLLSEHLRPLGHGPASTEAWEYIPALREEELTPGADLWAREPGASGLLTEQTLLVLREGQSLLLGAAAATLWSEAGTGQPLEELEGRLARVCGPAPRGVLPRMLGELQGQELLRHIAPPPDVPGPDASVSDAPASDAPS